MSLIPCTSLCVYQLDGTCTLQRTMSSGTAANSVSGCVHFIQVSDSDFSRQERVPDGFDHSEF